MNEAHPSILDPEVVRRLLRHLRNTDVDELEVEFGDSSLLLRRRVDRAAGVSDADGSSPQLAPELGTPVIAPLTGIVYTRAAPDQPPYVAVGDAVEAGQVVALIETMKLFNEVTTEIAGTVTSIVIEEGALVDSGQPILYLRPQPESET
ncbi:MAG: acetyl-CoA carboxylase biotin carboxyl carrier protein [Chloroflexota bacterium]